MEFDLSAVAGVAMELVAWLPVVVAAASVITALTPTPDPASRLGKVYRVFEVAALVVGRAKDRGLIPPNPRAERIAGQVAVAREVIEATVVPSEFTGQPVVTPRRE